MPAFGADEMDIDTIGVALIVGGLAFLCSGLIFLLPTGRNVSSSQEDPIKERREKVDRDFRATRRERGDLS
jgi:hypothetical protein